LWLFFSLTVAWRDGLCTSSSCTVVNEGGNQTTP
jgi:hypothetical protein